MLRENSLMPSRDVSHVCRLSHSSKRSVLQHQRFIRTIGLFQASCACRLQLDRIPHFVSFDACNPNQYFKKWAHCIPRLVRSKSVITSRRDVQNNSGSFGFQIGYYLPFKAESAITSLTLQRTSWLLHPFSSSPRSSKR